MRLGIMADLHANALAVEAVLADGEHAGVDRWWVLGDVVAAGPEPGPTLELLAGLPEVEVLRGNGDRYALTGDRPPPTADDVARDPSLASRRAEVEAAYAWVHARLEEGGWLPWLASWPTRLTQTLPDGTRLLGVHASLASDEGSGLGPDKTDDRLRALFGAAAGEADIVLAGHTHRPTDRTLGPLRLVNPGSVSNPLTTDLRAAYAIVTSGPSASPAVDVDLRRVPYDHAEVIARIARSGHPGGAYLTSLQQGAHARFAP